MRDVTRSFSIYIARGPPAEILEWSCALMGRRLGDESDVCFDDRMLFFVEDAH